MTKKHGSNDDQDSTVDFVVSPERPIETSEQDVLDRGPFIKRLCQALVDDNTKTATGVVIGVTGTWGGGKSSILNLAHQQLIANDDTAVVVRFNPWLVSGRDELIGQFFAELIGTLNIHMRVKDKAETLIKGLAKYYTYISEPIKAIHPVAGAVISSVVDIILKKEGLSSIRDKLFKTLGDITFPIVVLIDEWDRVEDQEIRIVAQLIGSIGDFPNVSYLLAFDVERVAEALGDGDKGKGQAYLEKIVQFQIPLPITVVDELSSLFETEIEKLQILPEDWQSSTDYKELERILIPNLIQTPRDVKRLVSVFHVWTRMVGNEVQRFDMLGLAALQVKAPEVVDKIRENPNFFVGSKFVISQHLRDMSLEEKRSYVLGERGERHRNDVAYGALSEVLRYLFPNFNDGLEQTKGYNRICKLRSLQIALRLGLPPGEVSKASINDFLSLPPKAMEKHLKRQLEEGSFKAFFDQLSKVYISSSNINHMNLWKGVSAFLKKPDSDWPSEDSPMPEIALNFKNLFVNAVDHDKISLSQAKDVFMSLQKAGDITLTVVLLRKYILQYGLFGSAKHSEKPSFLTKEETEKEAKDASEKYRTVHLKRDLIAKCWGPEPIFIMTDTGVWDNECKKRMDNLIQDDIILDRFTLLFFRNGLTQNSPSFENVVSFSNYIKRLHDRLNNKSEQGPHETVCEAIKQALVWFDLNKIAKTFRPTDASAKDE